MHMLKEYIEQTHNNEHSTPSFAPCYDVAMPALLKRYARPRRNQIPIARNKGDAQTATSFQRSDPKTWEIDVVTCMLTTQWTRDFLLGV